MSDYCPFLCPICGNEMDGLHYAHNPVTNDSDVIVIDCEHCETLFQFHDSWDEVLTKLKYAYDPFPPDEIMRKAFAALADELDAQIAQEVADVWDVWEYMKANRERALMVDQVLYANRVHLQGAGEFEAIAFFENEDPDWLHTAAEHIRNGGTHETANMGKAN